MTTAITDDSLKENAGPSDGPAHAAMELRFHPERLDVIAAREQHHFWHAPRRQLIRRMIHDRVLPGGSVLDIGCGTGTLVESLCGDGFRAQGVDAWARERCLPAERFREGSVDALPWPDTSFDLVGLFDVLEHVEEAATLSEARRVLRPDGTLLVSVPAYDWLWGPRDELAGHLRRYSRARLREVVGAAGFEVERILGFQFLLLPLLAVQRLRSRGRSAAAVEQEDLPPRWLNAMLRPFNATENLIPWRWRPPFGSSLIAVARSRA